MVNLFLSYELGNKLKELGFDEPCVGIFTAGNTAVMCSGATVAFKSTHMYYKEHAAILIQQAFKWFREKHKLFASIEYSTTTQKDFVITINKKAINDARDEEYQTYEEAELACLEKLIEMVSK